MLIVDDPLLALIVRFVVKVEEPDVSDPVTSDKAFIQGQIETLKGYLAQFPREQKSAKAMEWIEQHAERYRKEWQKNAVTSRSIETRCTDCPLKRVGTEEFCEIHDQWRSLLQSYVTEEITSRKYIENALGLLQKHKKQLKHQQMPEIGVQVPLPGAAESSE